MSVGNINIIINDDGTFKVESTYDEGYVKFIAAVCYSMNTGMIQEHIISSLKAEDKVNIDNLYKQLVSANLGAVRDGNKLVVRPRDTLKQLKI